MKILIFEDNYINKVVIKNMLENIEYNELTFAENGHEGLEKMINTNFDLIFLDIKMPIMDGEEVMIHLNKKYKKEDIPYIIGLTANAMEDDREKYLKMGMNDYISKPYTIDIIKRALIKAKNKIKK